MEFVLLLVLAIAFLSLLEYDRNIEFRQGIDYIKSDLLALIRQMSRAVSLWDTVVGSAQHLLWPRRKGKVV